MQTMVTDRHGHTEVADAYDVVAYPRTPDEDDPPSPHTVYGLVTVLAHASVVGAVTLWPSLWLVPVVVVAGVTLEYGIDRRVPRDGATDRSWDPDDPRQRSAVYAVPAGRGPSIRREALEDHEPGLETRHDRLRHVGAVLVPAALGWLLVDAPYGAAMGIAVAIALYVGQELSPEPAPKVIATDVTYRRARELGADGDVDGTTERTLERAGMPE